MPDEQHHAAEAGSEPRPGESADAAPILDRPSAKSPLITAVEIENFKGIGRPVRIDLWPITLLFGRNSAGKRSQYTRGSPAFDWSETPILIDGVGAAKE